MQQEQLESVGGAIGYKTMYYISTLKSFMKINFIIN